VKQGLRNSQIWLSVQSTDRSSSGCASQRHVGRRYRSIDCCTVCRQQARLRCTAGAGAQQHQQRCHSTASSSKLCSAANTGSVTETADIGRKMNTDLSCLDILVNLYFSFSVLTKGGYPLCTLCFPTQYHNFLLDEFQFLDKSKLHLLRKWSKVLHSTQYRSFWSCSSQLISWLGTEKTKLNKTTL